MCIRDRGNTAVNESALTGESIPVDKQEGDQVSAATLNTSGYIKCRATRVGEDTTLSKIIQMVSDAAATKAPIAKIADKVSGVFVPAVIIIAVITIVVWLLCGKDLGFALARGISVLVISCPCALGLATPVAIMVGNGVGAKNGIMFKMCIRDRGRIEPKISGEVDLRKLIDFIIRGGWPANQETTLKQAAYLPIQYIRAVLDDDVYRIDNVKRDKHKMELLLRSLARNEMCIRDRHLREQQRLYGSITKVL